MVNTLTSQFLGVAKVPLFSWGNTPANKYFDGASVDPIVANGISEGVNGNMVGVNVQRLLPNGGVFNANLGAFTGTGTSGAARLWSYFDDYIWSGPTIGANGFPFAQTSYRFKLPRPNFAPPPVTPQVRNVAITYNNGGSSLNAALPNNAVPGDLCFLIVQNNAGVFTPSGFSGPVWNQGASSGGGGLASYTKVLTVADIAAGVVAVSYTGVSFGSVLAVVMFGNPTIRTTANGNSGTIGATAQAGDLILFFGGCTGNGAVTNTRGSPVGSYVFAQSSGLITGETAIGNDTTTFSYPVNTGHVEASVTFTHNTGVGGQYVQLFNRPQIALDTVFQTNKGNYTQYFPFMYQGRKAGVHFFYGQNPAGSCNVWVEDTGNYIIHAFDFSQIFSLGLRNIWANRLIPGAAALSNVAQFDNCITLFPGGSGAIPIPPPNVTYINSLTGNQANFNHALDIPALNTIYQANAQPVNPTTFQYGFIYPLPITTAGNIGPLTGQSREILVFNTDMTQYYAIQIIPQDAGAQTVLTAGGNDFFDFRWSISIDEFGVVYMGNNITSTLLTSYSPLNFFIPSIQAPPLNPFTLPCYNTCSPVDFAEP